MSVLTTFLAAVSVAEIVVLVVECILVVAGAAVIAILQNFIKKSRQARDGGAVAVGVQSVKTASDGISRDNTEPAVSTSQAGDTAFDATATTASEVTENSTCPELAHEKKSGCDVSGEGEAAKADGFVSENGTDSDADGSDGGHKEETQPFTKPETPRKSAAEIFAEYETRNGTAVVNDAPQEVDSSDLSGKVSELQAYLNRIKSGSDKRDNFVSAQREVLTDKEDSAGQNEIPSGNISLSAEKLSYIDPASPSGKNDATFANYSETDKDYLLKHIAKSREQYSSTPRPEHEKVDWDKVKQYNSAILSVGEINEDTDKK